MPVILYKNELEECINDSNLAFVNNLSIWKEYGIMHEKMSDISFRDTSIEDGFWKNRQRTVSETSIYSIWERFKETGRFNALNFNWKDGQPNRPHFFWDSDIAKWIESVAYLLESKEDKTLEDAVDEVVDLIQVHQDVSGYFNIYFTVIEPDERWKRRTDHELYCAGHLIEAAVAYFEATGKDKFLNVMIRYANHIEKVFLIDKTAAFITPGHEEIELALVKLYHCTGERRYLELSKFFIDHRGQDAKESYYNWANARYAQDHLPVREQSTAEGHAVRAVYLYSGMADIAREYEDENLFIACRRIFQNIMQRRMYITGGIGSSAVGEAFTIDYDLPNLTAYSESCAALGLALFARRMLLLDVDSMYSDITERVLYNGFLSSISLGGKSFFYENPIEIHPELLNRDISVKNGGTRLPITQRKEVFDCSCCPPNITRFIASIGDFLYTNDKDTLFVHHYMASVTKTNINEVPMEIFQQTSYPLQGNIAFSIKGSGVKSVAFRIPYWCENYNFTLNGNEAPIIVKKGYAYISRSLLETDTINVIFEIKPQLIEASPKLQENSGRVALQRGPIIYCLEAIDNGDLLRDVRIDVHGQFDSIFDKYYGVQAINTIGYRRIIEDFENSLYKPVSEKLEQVHLKFIPYYGFANRGESEMIVWVLKK